VAKSGKKYRTIRYGTIPGFGESTVKVGKFIVETVTNYSNTVLSYLFGESPEHISPRLLDYKTAPLLKLWNNEKGSY
jgi:hypothetical protein